MPVLQSDAGRVRVVSGRYDGWDAPLATPEPLLILDGWLRPERRAWCRCRRLERLVVRGAGGTGRAGTA
ncbi:hypothetical protein BN2877_54490 [Achromobacter xylosoxidans]|nr:hypothetical protein BN2877_54490 [Achromobacter xylosoxidans]